MTAKDKPVKLYAWLDEERNIGVDEGTPMLWGTGYDAALHNVINYLEMIDEEENVPPEQHQGIALRDYFAAQAMSPLIANNPILVDEYQNMVAEASFRYADAMLRARM